MKTKVKSLVVLACIFVATLAVGGCGGESHSKLEAWNTYNGKLADYRVRIEESKENGIWTRIVHLDPINGYEKPNPDPFGITGHDYDGDGQFDRIFIQESSVDGCNAVLFTGKGSRTWEPCPADKETAQPFTDEQVTSAQAKLYLAMATVCNKDHLLP